MHFHVYLLVVHQGEHAFRNVAAHAVKAFCKCGCFLYKRAVVAAHHLRGELAFKPLELKVHAQVVQQADYRLYARLRGYPIRINAQGDRLARGECAALPLG